MNLTVALRRRIFEFVQAKAWYDTGLRFLTDRHQIIRIVPAPLSVVGKGPEYGPFPDDPAPFDFMLCFG
jgi:hypothetical protein